MQRGRLGRYVLQRRCGSSRKMLGVARHSAQRWCGAECLNLRGAGQAERVGRAIHLSVGRAWSVRQHPGLRNAIRRRDVPQKSDVNEGGKMSLLGKLNWSAIPFDQPIIMGASGGVVLVIVLVLGWITFKGYLPYLWRERGPPVHHKRHAILDKTPPLHILLLRLSEPTMLRAPQSVR